jgi:hypothetical protein
MTDDIFIDAFCLEDQRERDYVEELDVDRRIQLERIIEK